MSAHASPLPLVRWLGRGWACRCGAEWFCLLGRANKRIWVARVEAAHKLGDDGRCLTRGHFHS